MAGELIERLRAAIDETEEVALAAAGLGASGRNWRRDLISCVEDADGGLIVYGEGTPTRERADHIARHDPASVLRMVTAHRKILELHVSNPLTQDMVRISDGTPVATCISCGGWYAMKTGTEWPCATLLALAEVYSIES